MRQAMTQARFMTVGDLFAAFPTAIADVGDADHGAESLAFVRTLADSRDWQKAISFCAYLLSKRSAVAWGCRSLRRMVAEFSPKDLRALSFAEAWVEQPEEVFRGKALALGNVNDHHAPATWLALAAGWSGGSVYPPECDPVPPEPEKTARAVRVALFMALSVLPPATRDEIMPACLQDVVLLVDEPPPMLR
jgi:hypothetical protein